MFKVKNHQNFVGFRSTCSFSTKKKLFLRVRYRDCKKYDKICQIMFYPSKVLHLINFHIKTYKKKIIKFIKETIAFHWLKKPLHFGKHSWENDFYYYFTYSTYNACTYHTILRTFIQLLYWLNLHSNIKNIHIPIKNCNKTKKKS